VFRCRRVSSRSSDHRPGNPCRSPLVAAWRRSREWNPSPPLRRYSNSVLAKRDSRRVAGMRNRERPPDPWDHPFSRRTVRSKYHLRHAPKPASVRHEAVDPNRLPPRCTIETAVGWCVGLLHDDPAMSCDDAAPANGACRKDAHGRALIGAGGREKPALDRSAVRHSFTRSPRA
jgi:hypothetical protein